LNKLTPDYDYSCRYNGGIVTEPTELDNYEALQMLPHGIKFDNGVTSILGNGVVIDAPALLNDFSVLSQNGIGYKNRLIISDRSNLVTNLHKRIADKLKAIRKDSIWLQGEDVTQSFKPIKMALRVSHLVDDNWTEFEDKYHRVRNTCEQLYNVKLSKEDIEHDFDSFKQLRSLMKNNKLVDDTVVLLNKEIKNKKRVIVEDASSSSMDIDTGLYPFTDSFHTTTGAVCTGLGVPEEAIETTIGVFSAVSIIRNGFLKRIKDFPTHIHADDPAYASISAKLESEYEVMASDYAFGWTDLNLIRHAELLNKLSSMMLTHLDVLNEVETIKLATKYTLDDGSKVFDKSLPSKLDDWGDMVPEYIELPGWQTDLAQVGSFQALPTEA